MHLRPLVPMGLALLILPGCQSYFPYGYGNTSPYPGVSGTYTPPVTTSPSRSTSPGNLQDGSAQFPTPTGSRSNAPAGQNRGQSSQGQVPDSRFSEPGRFPSNLGSPAAGDDNGDSIRRGTSSHDGPTKRIDEAGEDLGDSLSSTDGEEFKSPTPYRQASASSDDPDVRRPSAKPVPSPYKKDPGGYKWLRGVVARDPKTNAWRITYSRNPLDNDPYRGSLTLIDDELLDSLMDDDVIYVEGKVDPSAPDRYGKPSYRVIKMTPPLHPKEE